MSLQLRILCAVAAGAVVIGELGDIFGAWQGFSSWLHAEYGVPTNVTLVSFLLFVTIVILLAFFINWIKNQSKETEKETDDSDVHRADYLSWFGNDVLNRLESSIHMARFIDLRGVAHVDAVTPWHYTAESLNKVEKNKPVNSIEDFMAQGESRILLLGGPGSGKTTTLPNIANVFCNAAKSDVTAPIPVLFNLSLWGQSEERGPVQHKSRRLRQQPKTAPKNPKLDEWLVQMLVGIRGAGVTERVARSWLRERRLVLLLDGLDESKEALRGVLLREINSFLEANLSIGVVVCCRSLDYEALAKTTSSKIEGLKTALTINPLDEERIRLYLKAARATRLEAALDDDPELRELAQTPLELSVMVLAYGDDAFEVNRQGLLSLTRRRMQLFDSFVEAMTQRKARRDRGQRDEIDLATQERIRTKVSNDKLNRQLGWLARRMSERSRSSLRIGTLYEFLMENRRKEVLEQTNLTRMAIIFCLSALILFCLDLGSGGYTSLVTASLVGLLGVVLYLAIPLFDESEVRKQAAFLGALWLLLLPLSAFVFGGLNLLLPWADQRLGDRRSARRNLDHNGLGVS